MQKIRLEGETRGDTSSRRRALALMLGAGGWLPGALAAADRAALLRLAISESLISDVNLNDARAAMTIWIKRMMVDLNMVIDVSPAVFDTTEEILHRARTGRFDVVALNVVEYRQVASLLDPSEIVSEEGAAGMDRYVLLVKRGGGIERVGDLRGRKLIVLKGPKMCVADAWLSTILDEGHFGGSEQFFGTVTTQTKASRVVLPVFFGQADACLTSKRGFDMMSELNPQVARNLTAIASSSPMVLCFYVFRKNYRGLSRESFAKVTSDLRTSAAGRQLATLFQFDGLTVRDAGCLAPALAVLEMAERVRGKSAGSPTG